MPRWRCSTAAGPPSARRTSTRFSLLLAREANVFVRRRRLRRRTARPSCCEAVQHAGARDRLVGAHEAAVHGAPALAWTWPCALDARWPCWFRARSICRPTRMTQDLVVQRPKACTARRATSTSTRGGRSTRAVITHAHADHARRGHGHYLAAAAGRGRAAHPARRRDRAADAALRRGDRASTACASLHPAGHVLGSAQVRLEHGGQVWVASGDYYVSGATRDDNATCAPFEPVRCDCFITESTFGLPIYRWQPQAELFADIDDWWRPQRRSRPRQRADSATASARRSASCTASTARSARSSCTARSSR